MSLLGSFVTLRNFYVGALVGGGRKGLAINSKNFSSEAKPFPISIVIFKEAVVDIDQTTSNLSSKVIV